MAKKIVLIFIILVQYNTALAGFFNHKKQGWHWYETAPKKPEIEENKNLPVDMSATEIIELQKQELNERLNEAIVSPTPENISNYLAIQKKIMMQSQQFSQEWQKVVFSKPQFDETIAFPMNNKARHIYLDMEKKVRKKNLQDMSKEYGLFFFYRGSCRYCKEFAPYVAAFARKYNWNIVGVSLDGELLDSLESSKVDNGIASKLGISHVPALIAVHTKTKKFIPLAFGMVSESEIEERAYKLNIMSEIKQ